MLWLIAKALSFDGAGDTNGDHQLNRKDDSIGSEKNYLILGAKNTDACNILDIRTCLRIKYTLTN